MSNASILQRLEQALAQYEAGAQTRTQFVLFLRGSLEALEGVPYSVLVSFGDLEKAIEMEGYAEEEGLESKVQQPRNILRALLRDLKTHFSS